MFQRYGLLWLLVALCCAAPGCTIDLNNVSAAEEETEDERRRDDDDDDDDKEQRKKKGKKGKKKPAKGKVTFEHRAPSDSRLAALTPIMTHQHFRTLVKLFDDRYAFPRHLQVRSYQCGRTNAFFSPSKHMVNLCYELANHLLKGFMRTGSSRSKAMEQTTNAYIHIFLHEMGHAVIGELDLGVTGGEEDSADDFATLILLKAKRADIAKDGALAVMLAEKMRKDRGGAPTPYFDTHSHGEQRFYNNICLIYGSNPTAHAHLVNSPLPKSRAVRCRGEFHKKYKGWARMLKPHEK